MLPPSPMSTGEIAATDADLDALYARVATLHDGFARQDFEFRIRLGHELLDTLFHGQLPDAHRRGEAPVHSVRRFFRRHQRDLSARGLSEDLLGRCVRVAAIVPDPLALPPHITFSHLLELAPLPPRDRDRLVRQLQTRPMTVEEIRRPVRTAQANERAAEIEQQELADLADRPAGDEVERPEKIRRNYPGNVPRRLDAVLQAVVGFSPELVPELAKRPDVAGEALERWLKIRDVAARWVEELTRGGDTE